MTADRAPERHNAGLIGCRVDVAGANLANGFPDDPAAAPYVLSGLNITWGRDDTVGQPEPATCSFTVVDEVGDQAWARTLKTGKLVTVDASAKVYADANVQLFHDPTFQTYADGAPAPVTTYAGTATIAERVAGNRAVRVLVDDDVDVGESTVVVIPPRPWIIPGTPPNAWDSLPRWNGVDGQTWKLSATVVVPAGMTARIRPLGFISGVNGVVGNNIPLRWSGVPYAEVVGTGLPVTVAGDLYDFGAELGPIWVGLRVTILPSDTGTWDGTDVGFTWNTYPDVTWSSLSTVWIDDVSILAPAEPVTTTRRVFAGRITDTAAGYSKELGAAYIVVTAQDHLAELANVYVGDAPWPAESASARISRILGLVGNPNLGPLIADARPAGTVLSRTDVDRQSALSLIQAAATSVDAVLRIATPISPAISYLRLEDPAGRPPLRELRLDTGGLVRIFPTAVVPAGTVYLPADIVDLDVEWVQDVADVVSRVSLSWQEQTTPDLTERTVTVTDAGAYRAVGDRSATVSTQLASAINADVIAQQILSRLSSSTWRMRGVNVDTSDIDLTPAVIAAVLPLLDANTRPGQPILITGIPEWTPAPADSAALYVEGGSMSYLDGCWSLALNTSAATGLGLSATWDELGAAWSWDQFDPAITWDDLNGIGARP